MIIDGDCHISSRNWDALAQTAPELVARLDRAGVDRALIWLKPPYDKNIEPENQAVYEAARLFPDRMLGFGWANPQLGHQRTLDTIQRCFEDYNLLGIKFNGAQDNYVIDDPAYAPMIEAAARYGKPIAFHIGADFYENTHPYRLGAIAARFPEIPFLMVHMGGAGLPALNRAAVETALLHPNITLIASSIGDLAVLGALKALGAERVCFGSDSPFHTLHAQLALFKALLEDFSPQEQALVLGGNLARLLHL